MQSGQERCSRRRRPLMVIGEPTLRRRLEPWRERAVSCEPGRDLGAGRSWGGQVLRERCAGPVGGGERSVASAPPASRVSSSRSVRPLYSIRCSSMAMSWLSQMIALRPTTGREPSTSNGVEVPFTLPF